MKYKFLILSNQPFDFELKTNKWHIATRLAERGHGVVYVDPPLRFRAMRRFLKSPSKNIGELFFSTEKKNENLIVYRPGHLFNFWPFSSLNTKMHSKNINSLLKSFGNGDTKTIIWIYHFDYPDLENLLDNVDHDLMLYDVVDEYTAFPEYLERKRVNPSVISWIQWFDDELKIQINQKGKQGVEWVLQQEKWLSDKADLVFASAPGLVNKFKKWRGDVHYLPNGVDIEKFDLVRKTLPEPDDVKNIPHPWIGFSGAIDTYKNNIP